VAGITQPAARHLPASTHLFSAYRIWQHQGAGKLSGEGIWLVADRRLGSTEEVLGVVAAAATLATATVRAKMRRASFIEVTSLS